MCLYTPAPASYGASTSIASHPTTPWSSHTVFGSKTLHRYSSKVGAAVPAAADAAHSVVASMPSPSSPHVPAALAVPVQPAQYDATPWKSAENPAATAAEKAVAASCAQHASFVKVAESLLGQLHEQSIADSAAAPS